MHGQDHICGLGSRPHLTFKIQRSRLNPLVTFEAWSSINMFAFRFMAIGTFLAEIQQILYLSLKIQGQGHGQGQTWWSHLNPRVQTICLLFVLWQSDHFWLIYSKFFICPWKFKVKVMMKIHQNPPNQVIYRWGPTIVPKTNEILEVVQKLSREQESAAAAYELVQKHKVTPVYRGDLIKLNFLAKLKCIFLIYHLLVQFCYSLLYVVIILKQNDHFITRLNCI